jgi:hypothetical protein
MRKLVVVLAALALVAIGAIAYASIPDGNGVIHGCRKNSGGALRVIDSDAGQTCMANETALNWSQAGPPGVSGYEVVQSSAAIPPNATQQGLEALCPSGKKVLGGGWRSISSGSAADTWVAFADFPLTLPSIQGWHASIEREGSPDPGEGQFIVWAICASVTLA